MTGIASHRRAWDAMMAHYLPGRADLIAAGCAETERVLGRPPRSVLDLGGGPGTTIEALLHRWPHTSATLIDIDPVLLALAHAGLPTSVAVRTADLARPCWVNRTAGLHELALAVMTLHHFPPVRVQQLYREIRDQLAPGGLLLIAEPMPAAVPAPTAPVADPNDPWPAWWCGAAREPALQAALAERERMPAITSAEFVTTVAWHHAAVLAVGFADTTVVHRAGDHVLLSATTEPGHSSTPPLRDS